MKISHASGLSWRKMTSCGSPRSGTHWHHSASSRKNPSPAASDWRLTIALPSRSFSSSTSPGQATNTRSLRNVFSAGIEMFDINRNIFLEPGISKRPNAICVFNGILTANVGLRTAVVSQNLSQVLARVRVPFAPPRTSFSHSRKVATRTKSTLPSGGSLGAVNLDKLTLCAAWYSNMAHSRMMHPVREPSISPTTSAYLSGPMQRITNRLP
jgi:hypothetical protein